MGVPTSEVGCTIATTSRENTKVHKNMWWNWGGGLLSNFGSVLIKEIKVTLNYVRWARQIMQFFGNQTD